MAVIAFADVLERQLLPLDAQDVVSQARLIIAGSPAGEPPAQVITREFPTDTHTAGTANQLTPYWLPVTHVHASDQHSVYRTERSFGLPEGFNPFLVGPDLPADPTPQIAMQSPGSPSAVRDGDPATFGGIPDLSVGGGVLYYNLAPVANTNLIYGWRLVYSLTATINTLNQPTGTPGVISAQLGSWNPNTGDAAAYPAYLTSYLWGVGLTPTGERSELYGLCAFDPRLTYPDNQTAGPPDLYARLSFLMQGQVSGELRVYEFIPMMLNVPLLDGVAAAQVRLPADLPQRITVRVDSNELIESLRTDRVHTIVGWPGGDLTATVAQVQFELRSGELLAVIDLEQAGSPVGLAAEAIEAARERRITFRADIRSAGYGLMMGERQ